MARVVRSPTLLAAAVSLLAGCGSEAPDGSARPNVLLVTIDTLRADRLGCYGAERPTSPNLDRLAAGGLVFDRAYSQAPWTLPAMASLMTSLHPSRHGAVERETRLPEAAPVLAEVLSEAGYRTAAVVSHIFVSRRYGFERGFDAFTETDVQESHHVASSARVTRQAIAALDEVGDGPFFLWAHYFDPHSDYMAHEEHDFAGAYPGPLPRDVVLREVRGDPESLSPADVAYLEARYDGEIAFTDRWIGRLLSELETRGLAENTIVVVTADHGEQFLDHGELGHGRYCWDELVRVPLIVGGALPERLRGRRSDRVVETRSVPASLAELCGVGDHPFEGGGLLDGDEAGPGLAVVEGSHALGPDDRRLSVVVGTWKLVRRLDDGGHELYDLEADPGETRNVWDEADEEVVAARKLLQGKLEGFGRGETLEVDSVSHTAEEQELLQKLGYLGE